MGPNDPSIDPTSRARDLDLTTDPPTKPLDPYSVERHRESVRGRIAGALVGIIGLIVVAPLVRLLMQSDLAMLNDYLRLVLPAMIGLVGPVLGFYFSRRK